MAEEFKPINTQEEFDAAVTARYGDVANFQQQITTLTGERDTHAKTIADLQSKVKGYEAAALKQRIAHEKKLPYEMASRLSGETEDDIRKDADNMVEMIRAVNGPAPLYNPEPKGPDANTAGLTNMLAELRGE